ncbi:hypothetical protein [Desulfobulbus alkaliphilus]|uniref:hypothetical protein n=1 Tax=Desulfobulbus alkaliphilus TaxID=869814 RepID=UPI001962BDD4|nr:hypothetical protein [Desulfobulbus alkaliphilus]MBM9538018.1 hypothetical protein [Desulfobulbus alkaliphilus]
MTNLIEKLRNHLKTVVVICLALLAVISGLSLLIDSSHAHSWADRYIPFFWSFFGFAAAAAIIGITHVLRRAGIQAPTTFYDRSDATDREEEQ